MNAAIRLALPFAAFAALTGCGETPDQLFAKARHHFAAEDFTKARLDLVSALADRPDDRAMLLLLAETHLRLGDPDGAEAVVGRLERAGAPHKSLARLKANIALLRGNPKEALTLLGQDETVDGWRIRGESLLALGDEQGAKAAFERGMSVGTDVRLAAAYGRFLLLAWDIDAAGRVLAKLQAMAPRSYEALVMAGDLAVARGSDDDAIVAYRKTIDAFPDRVAPMLALASLYDGAGNVNAAAALVDQAGKIAPDDAAVEGMRFQIMAEKGEWEKIRLALQGRESTLQPGSALSMTYGEALLRLGHSEQARVIFRRATLVQPGNRYARMMLGEALLATGDAAAALQTLGPLAASTLAQPEVLQKALEAAKAIDAPEATLLQSRLEPRRLKAMMALVDRGEQALAVNDWKTAAIIYERLSKERPDPEVLKRLALAKSGLGDGAAAITHADRAVALDDASADYLYTAGKVRLDGGRDLSGARRLFEAALALDPRNEAIARDLAKAKAAAG